MVQDLNSKLEEEPPSIRNFKRLSIGLSFNAKKNNSSKFGDKYAEFDDIKTIHSIKSAIESAGHQVILLEANKTFIKKVTRKKIDLVFNIAEGIEGKSRESHVPSILEMLQIPYTGSGVLTQALTLDKRRTKEILSYHKIPNAKFQLIDKNKFILNKNLKFPLIVKPNSEGSSKGITNNSLVQNKKELNKQVKKILNDYSQEALIEEYLPGREFTVGMIGNQKPKVLPIVEINFNHLPPEIHKFDSYEAKWIYDNPNSNEDPLICPAKINKKLKKEIENICLQTYKILDCLDFCRIDLRLDCKGKPNIIEVNALPGLIPDPKENSRFPRSCFTQGLTYNQIILSILDSAIKRYNLK